MTTTTTRTINRQATHRPSARPPLWAAGALFVALGAVACGDAIQPADLDGRLTLSPERSEMSVDPSQPSDVFVEARLVEGPRHIEQTPSVLTQLASAATTEEPGFRVSPVRPAEVFVDEYCDADGECFTVIGAPNLSGPMVSGPRPTWSWSLPAGAEGFVLRLDDAATWVELAPVVTTYTPDADLMPGLHVVEIAALDGEGNLSELVAFATQVVGPGELIPEHLRLAARR